MSHLSERVALGINRIRQVSVDAVTYRRAGARVVLDATPGSTPVETFTSFDVEVDATWRDWLIVKADLILSGRATVPAIGDRIVQADGTTWEVLPIEGQRCWRPSDANSYQIRVHTKLTSNG